MKIVKNDILILAPGNKVPADGILIKGNVISMMNLLLMEKQRKYIKSI